MQKKSIIIIIVLVVLVAGWAFLRGSEDRWICQDGEWIKHGYPSAEKPTEQCGEAVIIPDEPAIIVETPQPNDVVASPLEIKGRARGTWYFEGDFPVKLLDENDKEIAVFFATAIGEWMTEEFVDFECVIEFENTTSTTGTLVLEKDNPSGLPEFEEELIIPIQF